MTLLYIYFFLLKNVATPYVQRSLLAEIKYNASQTTSEGGQVGPITLRSHCAYLHLKKISCLAVIHIEKQNFTA